MSAATTVALFHGKTAWFAVNVEPHAKHLWFTNGGQLETVDRADFVFSERFEDEDMLQQLEGSRSDQRYPTAVLHPAFIEAACAGKSLTAAPIGRFLVMPRALRSAVRLAFPSRCRVVKRDK